MYLSACFCQSKLEGKKINVTSIKDSRRKVILFEDKGELANKSICLAIHVNESVSFNAFLVFWLTFMPFSSNALKKLYLFGIFFL